MYLFEDIWNSNLFLTACFVWSSWSDALRPDNVDVLAFKLTQAGTLNVAVWYQWEKVALGQTLATALASFESAHVVQSQQISPRKLEIPIQTRIWKKNKNVHKVRSAMQYNSQIFRRSFQSLVFSYYFSEPKLSLFKYLSHTKNVSTFNRQHSFILKVPLSLRLCRS